MPYRARVNIFDLLLLVLLVASILGGLRVGLVARLATWFGLAVGVLVATWSVPMSLGLVSAEEPALRLLVGLVVLALTVSVVTTLFQIVGTGARRRLARTPLSGVDRVAGAVAGVIALGVVVWFLIPAAADVPGAVARQVRTSSLVGALRAAAPPPPDAARAVRSLIDQSRFPEVFADLSPAPRIGPPPEDVEVPVEVVTRATASTVNVEAEGCARRYEGSGFAVATDTVVTNAHVVAGAEQVQVRRPDGAVRDATVVVYDPARDLALLTAAELGQEPLPLAATSAGSDAVVIGYPGGQDTPRPTAARVEDRRTALGRDVYGAERTERRVLFLSATLQQGDSGSPVVGVDGTVGGVVFAVSPDQDTTAYALDLDELEAVLDAPRVPGETGPCI